MEQEQERGFKVTDRRAAFQTEQAERQPSSGPSSQESPAADTGVFEVSSDQKGNVGSSGPGASEPLPQADFMTLLVSLYTQAQVSLGTVPDPMTQQISKEIEVAKYHIDLLGVLQKKTQGNLTQEEGQALEQMLYELRMLYVQSSR